MGRAQTLQRTPSSDGRVSVLREMRKAGETLPLALVRDTLELDLPNRELSLHIACCDRSSNDAFEDMLLRRLEWRPTALAMICLEAWRRDSRRIRASFLADKIPIVASRESTLAWFLEHAWYVGGTSSVTHAISLAKSGTLGEGLMSLLYQRAVQWSVDDEFLLVTAERTLAKTYESTFPDPLSAPAAGYVTRFAPEALFDVLSGPLPMRPGTEAVHVHHDLWRLREPLFDAMSKLHQRPPAKDEDFFREIYRCWPPTCLRAFVPEETAVPMIMAVLNRPRPGSSALPTTRRVGWELFAGFSASALERCLAEIGDDQELESARALIEPLLPPKIGAAETDYQQSIDLRSDNPLRSEFFSRTYRGERSETPSGDSPWRAFLEASDRPEKGSEDAILDAIRRTPPMFKQAVFRFIERERASVKFLSEISPQLPALEPHDLKAAIRALAAVDTPDALSACVRALTLAGVDDDFAFELCQLLAGKNLERIRGDVQSTLNHLKRDQARPSRSRLELIDAVTSLLHHEARALNEKEALSAPDDSQLLRLIPGLNGLPPDVVRPLRTAVILQASFGERLGAGDVDVGPLVELQYKAIEILFRHRYLVKTQSAIDDPRAMLQRRLDTLGYGNSGRTQVAAFEAYLASIPTIRDIPRFGRMKINRLLTSLAELRPGRRFSLDGIKSYVIFFLTFGRSTCDFGLSELFHVGAPSDLELFAFCRDLHTLHDLRNDAAHEGLASATSRDMQGLWSLSASLIQRTEAFCKAARS